MFSKLIPIVVVAAYHLAVGDLNGDGKPEIAASSFEGNAVTLLPGR